MFSLYYMYLVLIWNLLKARYTNVHYYCNAIYGIFWKYTIIRFYINIYEKIIPNRRVILICYQVYKLSFETDGERVCTM